MVRGSVLYVSLIALSACGGAGDGRDTASSGRTDCVAIDEGAYYFDGRYFTPISGASAEQTGQASPITAAVVGLGLPWLSVNERGPVAVLYGEAPDAPSKTSAVAMARQRIAETGAPVLVVDGVSVAGGARGLGAPLAGLTNDPSAEDCQSALDALVRGRTIQHTTGDEGIDDSSLPLADTLAAAVILCARHSIEIANHTDRRGTQK